MPPPVDPEVSAEHLQAVAQGEQSPQGSAMTEERILLPRDDMEM